MNTNQISLKELEGQRSVTTTFRLPKKSKDALEELGKLFPVPMKKLFEIFFSEEMIDRNHDVVLKISDDLSNNKKVTDKNKFIKKTIVLNKKIIKTINTAAKKYNIQRDSLISVLVLYYLKVIKIHNEKRMEKHKKAQEILEQLCVHIEETKAKLKDFLDTEDPIIESDKLDNALTEVEDLIIAINDELATGEPIKIDY